MPDPVIAAHEVLPNFFLLSGHAPISIRDQLLRARLLIDRLVDTKRIPVSKESPQLLVVGGGAAGVTAALRAAEREIDTRLVEKRDHLFGTQYGAQTRCVCPTQYDWPLDHYSGGVYPHPVDDEPLTLKVDASKKLLTGTNLAFNWRFLLNHKLMTMASPPKIDCKTKVETVRTGDNTFEADFSSFGKTTTETFPAIIWAAGFGKERCTLYQKEWRKVKDVWKWEEVKKDPEKPPYYVGRPFWGYDQLIGLSDDHRVLIAGGGDGALQDLLRVVTGMDIARHILHQFNVPTHLTRGILNAEERAVRARLWNGPKTGLPPYMNELELRHRSLIKGALTDKFDQTFFETVDGFFKKRIKERKIPRTLLAFPERYLNAYYALNRFLVLLIDEYFKIAQVAKSQRTVELRPNVHLWALTNGSRAELWEFVRDIDGPPGQNVWRAKPGVNEAVKAEEGHWFTPEFVNPKTEFVNPNMTEEVLEFPQETFDRTVIRFGYEGEPPPLFAPKLSASGEPVQVKISWAWHMLPYHLPK